MKITRSLLSFIVLISLSATSYAQNQVFALVSQQDQTQAIDAKEGNLSVSSINTRQMLPSQKFILKRLINGNIMIASAAHPDKCLKHTGTSVALATVGEDTQDFEWRIEYLDDDEYLFKHATLEGQCLAINPNNEVTISPIVQLRKKPHRGCCRFVLVPEDNPF